MAHVQFFRRFLRHPFHGLVAHLPLGLWIGSAMFDYLALRTGQNREPWILKCSFICMALGTAFALITSVTGFLEYLRIPENHRAQLTAIVALGAHLAATTLYVFNTGLRWRDINRLQLSRPEIVLAFTGLALAVTATILASRLIHTYALGLERDDETPPTSVP